MNRDKIISDVKKFSYHKGFHTGDARATVKGLALTDMNYREAIGLLKEGYGNRQAIVNNHMLTITSEKDTKQMMQLCDQIETHLKSLISLGVNPEKHVPF